MQQLKVYYLTFCFAQRQELTAALTASGFTV